MLVLDVGGKLKVVKAIANYHLGTTNVCTTFIAVHLVVSSGSYFTVDQNSGPTH